jgi:hypothetical protein
MVPDGLLEIIKNRLDITWSDADEDARLSGIITRGMAYLDDLAGTSLDYMAAELQQTLLIQFCMYDRANNVAAFLQDHARELARLQLRPAAEGGS